MFLNLRKFTNKPIPVQLKWGFPIIPFQVLEFDKGRLQNMLWKRDSCANCRTNATTSQVICLKDLGCAVRTSRCKPSGPVDCSLSIQVAFSGTDKDYNALNSWYEVSKLRQYSLYSLYSDLKSSVSSQLGQFF